MVVSAANLALVEEEREYLFGTVGLAQVDIRNLVTIASRMRTDEQFNAIVREGYGDIVSSYGVLLSAETRNFYNRLKEANGGDRFNGSLPSWSDTYDLRKDASIGGNTSLKYATDTADLQKRLSGDSVAQINKYSFATVNHLGAQDNDFVTSLRVPRATACAFCRWKAYEFSTYTRRKDVSKLDSIQLHDFCRCIAAPSFGFTESAYLNTEAQNLFADRIDEVARDAEMNLNNKADLKDVLSFMREDFRYR